MERRKKVLWVLVTVLVLAVSPSTYASAQDIPRMDVGTYQSPKGFGLSIEPFKDSLSFNSFTILADMFGILLGDYYSPGFKFVYCRKFIFNQKQNTDYVLDFYGGPGLLVGLGRDFHAPMSIISGMHGCIGGRFSFKRRLSVSFELGADLALKMNKNSRGNPELSIYRAGILHALYPEIRIQYNIK